MSILKVNGLKKIYVSRFGTTKTEALKKVDFSVEAGEYVAIMGESGSGKTTLLNIIAALDKPTAGSVLLDGKDIAKVKDSELAEFRRNNLGFVFRTSICWTLSRLRTTFFCRSFLRERTSNR